MAKEAIKLMIAFPTDPKVMLKKCSLRLKTMPTMEMRTSISPVQNTMMTNELVLLSTIKSCNCNYSDGISLKNTTYDMIWRWHISASMNEYEQGQGNGEEQ